MAEKSNEELLDAENAALRKWEDSPSGASHDRWQRLRQEVLARMAGPGEVVVQGWQPIETAPKDGTVVMVTWPGAEGLAKAAVYEARRWWNGNDVGPGWTGFFEGTHLAGPTHWISRASLRAMLAARPNNGGNDDAAE